MFSNCHQDYEKALIHDQLIDVLCMDYQSLWLINPHDTSMKIFKSNDEKIIPNIVDSASKFKTYDEARRWYIENYVVESSRKKLLKQTALEFVLPKIKDGISFFIEYGRINGEKINFNQLCYNRLTNPETNETEYVVLGIRDIDFSNRIEIDELTGLLNRRSFFSKGEEILAENPEKQFDIVLSDIVDFKKINETYGSDVGDEILKWHGNYLSTLLNDNLMIGRYGGDQMVLLGEHEYIHKCLSPSYREKFLNAMKNNGLPQVKFKYGLYLNIKRGSSIISYCDKAHMALNSIKNHYSNEVEYYNDELRSRLEKQRSIEESMRASLNNGDFKVYYQPKHDTKEGRLVGAEALIRWIHPEYGFMSPADFIPQFEQNGFIAEIDRFVGYRTCNNIRKWMEKGIKTVPISVNLSKVTLKKEDLLDDIQKAIDTNKLSPGQLHMEITETIMSENIERLTGILNQLRDLGCKVELDDFGSGYSSLNILSEFPIDILKLDMSFMQQFGNKKRAIVLESCIDMAKKLGFETVSEGVELKEQKDLLKNLGADMIQGYYYSKPLPEDEFEKYLVQNT